MGGPACTPALLRLVAAEATGLESKLLRKRALVRLFELGFTEEAGKPLAELYRKEERWQDLVMVLEHLLGHPEYDADWEECFELAVYSEQLAQNLRPARCF